MDWVNVEARSDELSVGDIVAVRISRIRMLFPLLSVNFGSPVGEKGDEPYHASSLALERQQSNHIIFTLLAFTKSLTATMALVKLHSKRIAYEKIKAIPRQVSSSSLSYFSQTDALTGYLAVGVFPPQASRLAFSSWLGRMCYLRVEQGCPLLLHRNQNYQSARAWRAAQDILTADLQNHLQHNRLTQVDIQT